jgi:RNA polymerase-associated protein CTR9
MAPVTNGYANGAQSQGSGPITAAMRFSDIPSAIDIPVSGLDTEEAVEVNLEELLDDSTELCQLLENEKASKNLWITIALAYAKQSQIDHAIEILNRGLASLARSVPKERLSLLGCVCWLQLLKSRQAPRVAPEGQLVSEAKTKDHFLREATSAINDALRINPAFPPLFLTRGVLFLLRASLQSSTRSGAVAGDSERLESLRQALKCFDEASKSSGGRNMMATLGKSRTLYLLGRYADALQGYQEMLSKMPGSTDPDPRIGIGCCLWQLGFKDRAKVAWERSLSLNPESKTANALLGVFYLSESAKHPATDPEFAALYKKAMTEYTQRAYKIDKDFPLSCASFANYFLLTGRYSTAEPLARKAIEQTDVNAIASDGWYLLARKEHNNDELQKASDFYNRADQARGGVDKGYLPAKFGVIQTMIQQQDLDGAKFRLEKLLQTNKSLEVMTLLGCLYAEEVFTAQSAGGKEDKAQEARKAISLLETVRKSWKEEKTKATPDESILLYLARLYETSQPIESMKCLQLVEAMQLDKIPSDDRPEAGEDDGIYLAQLREHLAPQLLNNMACFLFVSESYDLARDTFQIALNACVKLTEKQEAERENPDIEESDNDDTDALVTTISYNLARTYEALTLLPEARKVYEGLLARHSDYTDASARLAYIALRESPTDQGPKKIAALYQSDYGNIELRSLMGWYLNRSRRRPANIAEDPEQRHYKHTLQGYDKHDKYSLTGMGNIYLQHARDMPRNTEPEKEKRRKMYEKAIEFFDKALQLDSKNAYAAQGIAIALVEDKKDFSTAVQIFTKVRDTIRDPSVFVNLGHVYAELRQFQRSIENYEIALKKDGRGNNPQILACLSRVWLLKGKVDKSISSLNTALSYSQRALDAQPDLVHLQFNIAFVQFQIAQMVNTLPESARTSDDVAAAASGLEDAIITFGDIAKVKQPPYPRNALEQRAAMARNTMRKQLERAEKSQREYEEKNKEKLKAAKVRREEELKRREDEMRRRREEDEAKAQKIAEERQRIIEETEKMAEQLRAEQLAREAAEWTDDEETGERVKRKNVKKGGKRKKRDDDDGFIAHDESDGGMNGGRSSRSASRTPAADSQTEDKREKPKKRRKLERRAGGSKQSKYKSAEVVVESDEDEMELEAPPTPRNGVNTPPPANGLDYDDDQDMLDQDDDDEDVPVRQPTRQRKQLRTIEDDDEEEDVGDVDAEGSGGLEAAAEDTTATNIDLANAAMAAMAAEAPLSPAF